MNNPYEIGRYEHIKHQSKGMSAPAYVILVLSLAVTFTLLMA